MCCWLCSVVDCGMLLFGVCLVCLPDYCFGRLRGFSTVVMLLFVFCLRCECCLLVCLMVCYLVDLVCLFACGLLVGICFCGVMVLNC